MRKYFWMLVAGLVATFSQAVVWAQAHGAATAGAYDGSKSALAIAAGFGIAIAAFGGALGQSRAATAALEGIARNPGAAAKVQTPMIIALALIESLVIYSLVIAFLLQAKI